MVTINNTKELLSYYYSHTNTYIFNDDVTFNFDLDLLDSDIIIKGKANFQSVETDGIIQAKDLKAKDLKAKEIRCCDLETFKIQAKEIRCCDLKAQEIKSCYISSWVIYTKILKVNKLDVCYVCTNEE